MSDILAHPATTAKPQAVYRGVRTPDGNPVVTVDGAVLDPQPSWAIRRHSPDGFEWSYCGSGPAQLALALLLDATGQPETAELHYQAFKREVVAGWQDAWAITGREVLSWLARRLKGGDAPGTA